MSTGRIEGKPNDNTATSIARPAPRELAPITAPETRPATSPEPVSYSDFEALVDVASRRASASAVRSPQQCITDFVMPRISDPARFLGGRSISLLEQLVSDVLPDLDESEELRSLAGALITDEIERQRQLLMRLNGSIAL